MRLVRRMLLLLFRGSHRVKPSREMTAWKEFAIMTLMVMMNKERSCML